LFVACVDLFKLNDLFKLVYKFIIRRIRTSTTKTYQVHLSFDVVSESFHGNTGNCHWVPNHHASHRYDISRSEREHAQSYQHQHGHCSSCENGGPCHILPTRNMFRTLTRSVTRYWYLQGQLYAFFIDRNLTRYSLILFNVFIDKYIRCLGKGF